MNLRFRDLLGPPPLIEPGDHAAARAYVDHVIAVTSKGDWNRVERKTLSQLKMRWRRRADGRDPRFEIAGTRAGRLTSEEQTRVDRLRSLV